MNFFFDANLNRRLAKMMSALCEDFHRVVHITEHDDFKHNNVYSSNGLLIGNNTRDVEWMTALGQSGLDWKVLSGEADIIDTPHERAVLIEQGLTFFSFDHHWAKSTASEQAWKLVKIWDRIVECAKVGSPTLYRVQMGRQLAIEFIKTGARARGGRFRG